jgi:hypothetical protein
MQQMKTENRADTKNDSELDDSTRRLLPTSPIGPVSVYCYAAS